jgi:hypothetical protein
MKKFNHVGLLSMVFFALVGAAALSAPYVALAAQEKKQQASCMSRMTNMSPSHEFFIVVAASDQQQFEAKGFSIVPCNGREKAAGKLRQQMCRVAKRGATSAASAFERVYGVSPAKLCATTEKLAE